jgi:hypothetical protein
VVITIVVVAVVVGAIVRWKRGGWPGGRDGGTRRGAAGVLLAAAAHLFPAERRDWAHAMLVELDEIPGSFARWRFALGGAWTGLVAHGREPVPIAGMAVVLGIAVSVGVVTYAVSPVTHVLAVALAIALALAGISSPRRRAAGTTGTGNVVLGVTLLVGVAACVALTLFGVAAYPDAAADDGGTAVFSLVLAAALGVYVWVGLGAWPAADRPGQPSLVGGPVLVGLLLGTGWALAGVFSDHSGAVAFAIGVGAACLVVAMGFGARLARRGTTEGALVAVGLRTGLVTALAYFVVGMSATYISASWPVHDREVLEAFRISELPDLPTYMVSEALGSSIVGLIFVPALVFGAIWAGGALARSRPAQSPLDALGDVAR